MQAAGVDVLEVTAPDKLDRRRRGKNDDFDAQSAAHSDPAQPGWNGRLPLYIKGLPQNRGSSPADCAADHPDHNCLRP